MRRLELWSFINNLRKATDVAQLCASTAAVYLHRYLASTPLSADMDYYVAAACFFLGCKAEESPKGIDAVAVHAYNAIHHTSLDIKSGSSVKEVHELKEIILGLELKVLHAIAFDLQIIKPYKYLLARLQLWGVVQREAVQYAWNTVNDCFLTQACLVWGPEVLADACVVVSWHKRREVMGEPVGGISEAQVDELMRVDAVARAVARLEACFETVQQEIARRRAPMPA
jgi:cyclin T